MPLPFVGCLLTPQSSEMQSFCFPAGPHVLPSGHKARPPAVSTLSWQFLLLVSETGVWGLPQFTLHIFFFFFMRDPSSPIGSNLSPLQWKCGDLPMGLPGNSFTQFLKLLLFSRK